MRGQINLNLFDRISVFVRKSGKTVLFLQRSGEKDINMCFDALYSRNKHDRLSERCTI